jgi:hypothetical protein
LERGAHRTALRLQSAAHLRRAIRDDLGNISTYTIGYRYNPFMTSRAGFAWHNEYNWLHQDGTSPSGNNINTSELLLGFDFDF